VTVLGNMVRSLVSMEIIYHECQIDWC
jgi:hypothetical protein